MTEPFDNKKSARLARPSLRYASVLAMSSATKKQRLSPEDTTQGKLPPFEVAKAYAFDVALARIEEVTGQSACALLGQSKGSFIAANVTVKGGGHPSE